MKRLLIFVIFFLLGLNKVLATEVYYSSYGNLNEFTLKEPEQTELNNIISTNFCSYYSLKRIDGTYYSIDEVDPLFPYKDSNDYIIYNEYDLKVRPLDKENRTIYEKTKRYYQDIEKIRYIRLYDFLGGNNKFYINEIEVKNNNYNIEFDIICDNCSDNFKYYVKDNDKNFKNAFVDINGKVIIDLKDFYKVSDIEFIMHITDDTDDEKRYTIDVSNEIEGNTFLYNVHRLFFKLLPNNHKTVSWKIKDLLFKNPLWTEKIYTDLPIIDNRLRRIGTEIFYDYEEVLYKYYRYDKVYLQDQLEEKNYNDLICDMDSLTTKYQVQYRNKLELKKTLIIDDYNYNLNDFIIKSTVDDIEIYTDLNINENGFYKIIFITSFIEVEKNVLVDINRIVLEEETNYDNIEDNNISEENINIVIDDIPEEDVKASLSIQENKSLKNTPEEVKHITENKDYSINTQLYNNKNNFPESVSLYNKNNINKTLFILLILLVIILLILIKINKKSK